MKLLLKNTFKKIVKEIGRFISVIFIIAVGVAIFLGLREATAGMLYTADNYYDKQNFMDFKVISTHGFTKGDVESLKALKDEKNVYPSYSVDVLYKGSAIRVHALEEVNKPLIVKGRTIKNNNECLADVKRYKLNDHLTFERNDLNKFLKINSCKVVGLVKTPIYLREQKGVASVGNGTLESFVFIKRDNFNMDFYTEIYLVAKDAKEADSYDKEYDKKVEPLKKELEDIKPIREAIRYEEILKEAETKINDAENKLLAEKTKNQTKLDNSKRDLDNGYNKYYREKRLNDQKFINGENRIKASYAEINNNLAKLNTNIANLDKTIMETEEALKVITDQNQKDLLMMKLNSLKQIKEGLIKLRSEEAALIEGKRLYLIKMSEAKKKLDDSLIKYNDAKQTFDNKMKDASNEIQKGRDELNSIEKPKWYLQSRKDIVGYTSYKEDVMKVNSIARILPIFFVLIVILMCFNTITRMIEKERGELGILEALGFSKFQLILSYTIFILFAALLGLLFGLLICYYIFPSLIYKMFLALYIIPPLQIIVSPIPFTGVIGVVILITSLVSISASLKELKEVPAELLRPKAPKAGKKVFLERIPFIWNRLKFTNKITLRNIFRYKKRVLMTILGVAGSTALLLTAIGLNNSIKDVSKLQYQDIVKYNSMFILKDDVKDLSGRTKDLFDKVPKSLLINNTSFTFEFDNKKLTTHLIMPKHDKEIYHYIELNDEDGKALSLDDEGAIITRKMAIQLKAKINDLIYIRDTNNNLIPIKVRAITNNYVGHNIFMTPAYYEKVFQKEALYNTVIAIDDNIPKDLKLTDYGIVTAIYTKDILKTFDTFVTGINHLIIAIIVAACFLAISVLYNLTIINVSERKREVATLKVLGFYDSEVTTYIYKETMILSLLGIIAGLLLGAGLHKFVVRTAQPDDLLFIETLKPLSYIIAALLTGFFAFMVQILINRKLKKIDMIESLSNVE